MRPFLPLGMLILRRIIARKTTYVIVLVGVFVVWDLAIRFRVGGDNGDITHIELDGRPATSLHLRDSYLLDWFTLSFLGIVVIAPIVPSMMRRGHIEALHALPFSRSGILLCHVATGAIAYVLLMVLPFLMVFLLQGVLSSYWNTGLLLFVIPLIVMAACILCYLTLFAVLFSSTSMGILVTWLYVFIIPTLLQYREKALYRITDSDTGKRLIDIAYYVVPQVADMHTKAVSVVFRDEWTILPFAVSLATALPALLVATVIFRGRSF
jgi:ABC-type transport system involved in multi-copper enzyme maturation permease subunit